MRKHREAPLYPVRTCGGGLRFAVFRAALGVLVGCAGGTELQRHDLAQQLENRGAAPIREDLEDHSTGVPKSVVLENGLTSDEAVALALWNNPSFNALLSDFEVSRSDLEAAGMLPNPTLSILFPLGPKQLEFWSYWDISFLWQRNGRVEMASLRVEEMGARLVQSGLQLAREARVAHARAKAAESRVDLAASAVEIWNEILRISEVRHSVQAANDIELASVQTDAKTSQLQAQQFHYDMLQSRIELQRTLGYAIPDHVKLVADALPSTTPPEARLLKLSHSARPDLRAAELSLEAAARGAGVADRDIFRITAIVDANGAGLKGFEMGPGAIVTLPIFNLNGPARDRAKAELNRAAFRYLQVKQQIDLDVRAAQARFAQARVSLDVWPTEILQPLSRNVELSTMAFRAGGTTHLAVLESTRRLIDARRQQVDLELALRIAQADLMLSVGRKFYD